MKQAIPRRLQLKSQVLENLQQKKKKTMPSRIDPIPTPLPVSLSLHEQVYCIQDSYQITRFKNAKKKFLCRPHKTNKTGDLIETLDQSSSQELETPSSPFSSSASPCFSACLNLSFFLPTTQIQTLILSRVCGQEQQLTQAKNYNLKK